MGAIGFDPTESLIVTNPDPVQGPCALSIDTGEVAWHFPDAHRTDRWDTCYSWAYAADRTQDRHLTPDAPSTTFMINTAPGSGAATA
ncbi:hypothetical protein [Nonomuraea glycinis]|uniref:hypothetical protein n=1 Tax=Nonomuraea glycinis TaxID=2047744 RepID=UPI0033BAF470